MLALQVGHTTLIPGTPNTSKLKAIKENEKFRLPVFLSCWNSPEACEQSLSGAFSLLHARPYLLLKVILV